MKVITTLAILVSLVFVSNLQAQEPDPFLGKPFFVKTFTAGDSAQYKATLVHYDIALASVKTDSSKQADSISAQQPADIRKAAVLYIHGFNDYFFQRDLAEKMDSLRYEFYAIDLHKYGRSYREGETIGELRDIAEYYAEIDSAIAFIRHAKGDSVKLVLLGHSTGGLIACLYAADHKKANIAAIVLNSPFLEMNYPWPVRRLAIPVLSKVGAFFPDLGIPRGHNENYDKSLLKTDFGEWEYNPKLKVRGSIPIDFGWLHAIHTGHVRVQEGLNLTIPILVMHSSCSFRDDDWSEEYTRCDGVLNVEHIREFGPKLGSNVQLKEIENGLHDLFLSRKPARDNAYRAMFQFLDNSF